MSYDERASFFLYSIGYPPEQLSLGHLLVKDFANPTLGLYTSCPQLSDTELQEWTYRSDFSGLIIRSHNSGGGFSVQVPMVADTSLQLKHLEATAILTRKGQRIVLKNPQDFLRRRVLQHEPARNDLLAWLTAADSALVRAKSVFRRPKVWLLTGLYELLDACTYSLQSANPSLSFGVDAELMAALAATPVGMSMEIHGGRTALALTETKGPAIWAARWQRIDARYIRTAEEERQARANLHITIKLLMDTSYPKGGLLGGEDENPDSVELKVLEEGISDNTTNEESREDENYDQVYREAVEIFKEDLEDNLYVASTKEELVE
ncbi:hypothetical protein KC360_g5749 [Hortaea werneckii]|nr:hypothetical protein KC325_g5634 [Hortaea werneckii]KAI6991225.1 hypothetical protein KC359_g6275 [Hortaea werneckii]KAI7144218.1 hypothetical protein KC344_g5594 [Hortaea werneckii]KAI7172092.1 hypothetical protein KC360_g5749 [Hortaea werneckii]